MGSCRVVPVSEAEPLAGPVGNVNVNMVSSTAAAVVRTLRAAPAFSVDDVAGSAGVGGRALRSVLGSLAARGRCAETAVRLARQGRVRERTAAVSWRGCPPFVARAAAGWDRSAPVRATVSGTASWGSGRLAPGAPRRVCAVAGGANPKGHTHKERVPSPPAMMYGLIDNPDVWVRRSVAVNPSVPVAVLAALANDTDTMTRRGVARNSLTPTWVLAALAADPDNETRKTVAQNPSVLPERLAGLSADIDYWTRQEVTRNPSTLPETLIVLSADHHPVVRKDVARNLSTPPETLAVLGADGIDGVRGAVAANPRTPPETLTVLGADGIGWVRLRTAQNPSTPPEVLVVLSDEHDIYISGAAAANLDTRR